MLTAPAVRKLSIAILHAIYKGFKTKRYARSVASIFRQKRRNIGGLNLRLSFGKLPTAKLLVFWAVFRQAKSARFSRFSLVTSIGMLHDFQFSKTFQFLNPQIMIQNFLVLSSQSVNITYFLFISKMDQPIIFVKIQEVEYNFYI